MLVCIRCFGALADVGAGPLRVEVPEVGGLDPEADALRARTVREAAGDGFILAADANQAS